MNFATWSIRQPIPSVALFVMLCLAGIFSFMRLPVTEFPNIDVPVISITISQPGAAPAELSGQIIKPVEDAVANITGVDHITSRATDSRASIIINFTIETPTDRALNDVKDAVSRIRQDLPETISEPIVKRVELVGKPIQIYSIADPNLSIEALSKFADDVIARRLMGLDGVGGVVRIGGADRVIRVELDPDRLLSLGITANDVSRQLRATNANMGGGRGDVAGMEYALRILGSASSVARLAATPITLPTGQKLRLEQLGRVFDGAAEPRHFATLDGRPVVALAVYRSSGASDLETAGNVAAELDRLRRRYPDAIIERIDDSTTYTAGTFDSAMQTLWEGMLLAVLVVFAFLRNFRATLIAATALPLSILPTFFGMYALGFSLNTVSLLGITLVTGILVDDAIVEVENIERHLSMGKSPLKAAADAATEIGLTVIAISLTIVAVFAPVSFMGGIPGQFFKQFGLTVAMAALFSLAVARLITPMMAAYLMKPRPAHGGKPRESLAMRLYLRLLRWTLRHKIITLLLAIGIFAASLYSATLLPGEFTPKKDIGRSLVSLELPPGTTLDETRAATNRLSAALHEIPEVRSVFVDGGAGGDISKAEITLNYGPKTERTRGVLPIEADIMSTLARQPDARAHLVNERGHRDVSISVLGNDREEVGRAARELARQMKGLAQLVDVSTTAALPRPEIQLIPRKDLAAEFGITANALASVLRVATLGDSGANLAKFTEGDEQYPIVVRLSEADRRNLLGVQDMRITTPRGQSIPVRLVADVRLTEGPSVVNRYDREFETKVEASLAPGYVLGEATDAIDALPIARNMPPGVRLATTGDAEIMADIFSGFATAMGAGILLVYMLLAVLFSSFARPIVVLLTLPLAVGGAIFALYLFDMAMGIAVVIGFLLLMGIVTKNAIMLLAFALDAMKRGASRAEAMVEAGRKRARPILMTSIAMTAGMLPSAFASHLGGEFRAPMAIAVIGGIILSTALSLIFVPVLFSLVDGSREWLLRRVRPQWAEAPNGAEGGAASGARG